MSPTEAIHTGRLIGAGLVAALILNLGEGALHGAVLAQPMIDAYAALGQTVPEDPANIIALVLLTIVQGILLVWLAVVLRPRMGSAMQSAIVAGLIGWVLSAVYGAVYLTSGYPGLLPAYLAWFPVAWQLVEYPLAVIAGSLLYRK